VTDNDRLQEIICYIFLWRGDLAILICGVLRRAAFCGVFWHFVAFSGALEISSFRNQNFGGAQTPTPFSGRLKKVRYYLRGLGTLSVLSIRVYMCILVT